MTDPFANSAPARRAVLADAQAERALLACFVAQPSTLDAYPLPIDAWSVLAHEHIATAVRWLYDGGGRVTEGHIVQRLAQLRLLESCGGERAVYDLAVGDGLLVSAPTLHARVCALAALRRQREHLMRALAAVERESAAEAAMHCAAALEHATAETCESVTLQEAVLGSYARLAAKEAKSKITPTCIRAVDAELVGSGPGDLILVGARTNVGKTSFALAMADGLLTHGRRMGVILLEDPRHLIEDRLMAQWSKVPSRALKARDLTAAQHGLVLDACEAMSQLRADQGYVLSFLPNGSDADVIREMSRLVRVQHCDVLAVDYVQAMRCSSREQDRRTSLLASAARTKAAGVRLGVPVYLMSQLTTEAGQELTEPSMGDLRDCKDLEMIADTVMMLWRREKTSDAVVYGKVDKSKAEGLGTRFAFERGAGGSLIECDVPDTYSVGAYKPKGRR